MRTGKTFVRIVTVAGLVVWLGFFASMQSCNRKTPPPQMNSLFVIAPYKHQGTWVFDDPQVGLHQEPFVLGIDTMIDRIVENIPDAEHGFRAIFSAQRFPGAETKLEWRREESGGNWYYSDKFEMEGWLCPALFKYFPEAPREIWVKAESLKGRSLNR